MSITPQSLGLPTELWGVRTLEEKSHQFYLQEQPHLMLRFAFLAIAILIFLINLARYFINWDKAHLFYAIYALSLFAFYLTSAEERANLIKSDFFGFECTSTIDIFDIIFYAAICVSQILFFRHFSNSPNQYPILNKKFSSGIKVILLATSIELLVYYFLEHSQILSTILLITPIIMLSYILYLIYYTYKVCDRLCRVILTGSLLLILSSVTGMAYGFLPDHISSRLPELLKVPGNFSIFGGFVEFIFFSVGLSYRVQLTEQRNQQLLSRVELEQMRKQFYTNVTHEFRTPLTLIITPLQQILNGSFCGDLTTQHQRMLRNSKQLLKLINQLLKISKQEVQEVELQPETKEIHSFLRHTVGAFESIAASKKINFNCRFPASQALDIDVEKVGIIINNLLSNAFKFTPEGGCVSFDASVKQEQLYIKVKDSGIGMDERKLPYIFDRFYQINTAQQMEGSGIGLWTVKQLVAACGGHIDVQSQLGKGTTFNCHLPISVSTALPSQRLVPATNLGTSVPTATIKDSNKPTLLLAEDNEDMRTYMLETLADQYNVLTAEDGQAAWSLAKKVVPDLIVTDLMMPHMDGLTLTQKLRDSHITDHIPIIMLTAKAYESDKIEGLQLGAEAYLTKPFNAQELRIRIKEMLKQRRRLRRAYAEKISLQPSQIEVISQDDRFLKEVMEYVEDEIDNPDLEIEAMAKHVNMSRSQLYRKLKAITGDSPSTFIRNIRLERAKDLLLQRKATVSEIAYDLGFSTLSYFTRCFKEKFGVSPTKIKENHVVSI
ncbi:MAG: response regulator [Bacteroidota bacterium]